MQNTSVSNAGGAAKGKKKNKKWLCGSVSCPVCRVPEDTAITFFRPCFENAKCAAYLMLRVYLASNAWNVLMVSSASSNGVLSTLKKKKKKIL